MGKDDAPPTRPRDGSLADHVEDCGEGLLEGLMVPALYLFFIWILAVVVVGAFWVLLLLDWVRLTTEDLQHSWENTSAQTLCALFTAINLYALPFRLARLVGLFGFKYALIGRVGYDHRSLPAKEPFYLIPYWDRTIIVGLWLASAFTQFANQATRIVYATYMESMEMPGVVWTNVFFGASLLTCVAAGVKEGLWEVKIRDEHPGRFSSPLDGL